MEQYALLCGDTVIATGTASQMKRQKRQQQDYSDRPLRLSPLSKAAAHNQAPTTGRDRRFGRRRRHRETTKRLRLHSDREAERRRTIAEQDAALNACIAEDRRRRIEEEETQRNERAVRDWAKHFDNPENRAKRFDELFKAKNQRFTACLLRKRTDEEEALRKRLQSQRLEAKRLARQH